MMQDGKHFNYGYVYALSAATPLIKVIIDHAGQEFDHDESIEIFKEVFSRVSAITLHISRTLTIDPQMVRQRNIYLGLLRHNMDIVAHMFQNEIHNEKDKDKLIVKIEDSLREYVDTWHQLPYIESASGSTNEQMIRLQSCSFQVVSTLYQSVSNFPGGRVVQTTVNELSLFIKSVVEDFTKEFFDELDEEAIGIIQSDLLIMIGKIVSREWERYVRDYFRAGISPDRNRIKYMLSSFANSIKKKPLGITDVDSYVESMIDIILKIAKDSVAGLDDGCLEYNDMYERYIISRCCIVSSWIWEHQADNIGDRLDEMKLSEEERRAYESGEKPIILPDEFGREMYYDIASRISNEDYSVDMEDFLDLVREIIINYIGISEFINDMDIKV
jgi:hypothetical protein